MFRKNFLRLFCVISDLKLLTLVFYFLFFYTKLFSNEPLVHALKTANLNFLNEIFQRETSQLDYVDENHRNLIQQAVYYNQPNLIPFLLEKGVKLEHTDKNGKSVLEYLAEPKLFPYLQKALDYIENINQKNTRLLSIGGICVLANNQKCLDLILNRGFSPNSREGYQLVPILNLAYSLQMYSAVNLLLENGANPNLQDAEGESFLHLIAKKGDLKYLLKLNSPFVDQQNEVGDTPLHLAFYARQKNFILQLLNYNPSSTLANARGITPLHLAAQYPSKEILLKVLQNILDINDWDKEGNTPLIYAIRSQLPENVKILLEKGANPFLSKENSILVASDYSNSEIFALLLSYSSPQDIFTQDGKHLLLKLAEEDKKKFFDLYLEKIGIPKNLFLLHELVLLDKISFMQTLLKWGVNIDTKDHKQETPLFYAVQTANKKMIDYLISQGANPNLTNVYGETILHKAFLIKDIKLFGYLLSKKIDINIIDKDGNNLILKFIQSYFSPEDTSYAAEVIKLLVENGLEINQKNFSFYTALHIALEQYNYDLVNTVLSLKCDPNEPNKDGITPLEFVVKNYINSKMREELNYSLVTLLLKNGANPNLKNKSGRNLLLEVLVDYSTSNQKKIYKILDLLLEYGADPFQTDYEFRTAFELAGQTGDNELISKFTKKSKNKDRISSSKEWINLQYGTQEEDKGLALDTNKNGNHLLLGLFDQETKLFLLSSRGIALLQLNVENAKSASFDPSGSIFLIGTKKINNPKAIECSDSFVVPYFLNLDKNGAVIQEVLYYELGSCDEVGVGNLFFSERGFFAHFIKKDLNYIYFLSSDGKKLWSKTFLASSPTTKLGIDGNLYVHSNELNILLNNKGNTVTIPKKMKFLDFIFDRKNFFTIARNPAFNSENSILLEKYDPKGKKVWSRLFQTDSKMELSQIQVDLDDSIYVLGVSSGSVHNQPKTSILDRDIFLIKLDTNGKRLWTIQFGSDGDEVIQAWQITKEKQTLVLATSYGKVTGATHQGKGDITLFKFDENGEEF